MKTILSAVVLVAGIVSAAANPVHSSSATSGKAIESFATAYAASEPFYHVAGGRSYIGAFEPNGEACAVTLQVGAVGEEGAEAIKFDVPAGAQLAIRADEAGAALRLNCATDAKTLVINQTWAPAGGARFAANR